MHDQVPSVPRDIIDLGKLFDVSVTRNADGSFTLEGHIPEFRQPITARFSSPVSARTWLRRRTQFHQTEGAA